MQGAKRRSGAQYKFSPVHDYASHLSLLYHIGIPGAKSAISDISGLLLLYFVEMVILKIAL
jgi:hypothetical protein